MSPIRCTTTSETTCMAHLIDRLASQLRECAETLGAEQIDEQRAMRAYADAMALLAQLPHL